MLRSLRLGKELSRLEKEPPPGVSCWMKQNCIDQLQAQIIGDEKTPYSDGVFELEIQVPERYPMEPPKVRFVTPIYHPNIDTAGRICLDLLKMPPAGNWKPSLNIATLLTSIKLLMSQPNPDDPLMADISAEFQTNRALYEQKARQHTQKHAIQKNTAGRTTLTRPSSAQHQDDSSSQSDSCSDDTDQSDSSPDESDPSTAQLANDKPTNRSQGQKRPIGQDVHTQSDAKKLKGNP